MDKPRIGIVGTGWWATQHHIPSLMDYEWAEVAALADVNQEALERAGDTFGIERRFDQPGQMFGSGLVDGVLIAVPHAFHYEVAKAALDCGLHVFVEKPMVLRASHAWDLVTSAEAADLHLMVGYTYQYTRSARRLRKVFEDGELGTLLQVNGLFSSMVEEYFRGDPEKYRKVFGFPVTGPQRSTYSDPKISGGGQAQTQITHAMGMVLFATGDRVEEVHAYMNNHGLEVDLVDAIAYRMESGAIGAMGAVGSIRPDQPSQQEFRYYGTEGFALQDLLAGTVELHRNDGYSEKSELKPGESIYPEHLPARAFADLIAGRGGNPSPADPAARTVEFLEAAYRSASEHRPVKVKELL